eukprot:4739273-Amphidinium_carterae.1
MSRDDDLKASVWKIPSLISFAGPSSDGDLDEALIAETKEEVNNGWASGPFSKEDFDDEYGKGGWLPAR